MFSKVSYRRGVIEGVILFTLGRLGALITPSIFPDWTSVVAPLIFMTLEYILAPYWATRRIAAQSGASEQAYLAAWTAAGEHLFYH